jgi:DNA helicase-2/ATP-dependent DNA helicase PcrA
MQRIFGPPGTGKTTTLLNLVEQELSRGTHPGHIAFFAFTRKAANEAKERASKRFDLDPKNDLPYFRTLHSLAFHLTGLRNDQLMTADHYREVEKVTGVDFMEGSVSSRHEVEEELSNSLRKETPLLRLITLARLKMTSLKDEYNLSDLKEPWIEVDFAANSLKAYKAKHGLFDYTDMLELFANTAHVACPQFKLSMLDEAQDLSPLQWKIAHAIDGKSERMYCAGDDDQAIYKWSGADVEHFINLDGGSEVLEQSYRVPSNIHAIAERICGRIKRRFPKKYLPKKAAGRLQRLSDFFGLDMSHGSWLFLAQANYFLAPVQQFLKSQGYYFEYGGGVRSVRDKIRIALSAWSRLQNGEPISFDAAKALYSFMSGNGVRVQRGYKKIVGDPEALYSFEDLRDYNGLLAAREMPWNEALDKLPDVDVAYINALVRRGEDLEAEPRIRLSTIHGAKGGEADNVVLFTDITAAAEASMANDPDSMHRVFYVAVTRTRENLYTLEPTDFYRSYVL